MERKNCNGGIIDAVYAINDELKNKYHRQEKVAGFEKSKEGYKKLRFFDKDEKTIWLPEELYNKYNDYLVKNGALERGKTVIKETQTPTFVDICKKVLGNSR